jgi:hypothetical protein
MIFSSYAEDVPPGIRTDIHLFISSHTLHYWHFEENFAEKKMSLINTRNVLIAGGIGAAIYFFPRTRAKVPLP